MHHVHCMSAHQEEADWFTLGYAGERSYVGMMSPETHRFNPLWPSPSASTAHPQHRSTVFQGVPGAGCLEGRLAGVSDGALDCLLRVHLLMALVEQLVFVQPCAIRCCCCPLPLFDSVAGVMPREQCCLHKAPPDWCTAGCVMPASVHLPATLEGTTPPLCTCGEGVCPPAVSGTLIPCCGVM